jgi:tRNA threonylcarbamoyladenosine biosynthesis protein TsaB
MRLLALETSSAAASLALYEAGAVTRADHFSAGMTLCQELPGRIQGLLDRACAADAGLTALAVSLGPGSFTGLRVGLALAKAVAHCLELPLVGVPSPEVIAAGMGGVGARIAVLQHSRADEMYVTLFEADEGMGGRDARRHAEAATLVARLPEAVRRVLDFGAEVACGDAIARHRDALAAALGGITLAGEDQQYPLAEVLATLAAERVASADPQAMFALTPAYVVASQAERAAGEKPAEPAPERQC